MEVHNLLLETRNCQLGLIGSEDREYFNSLKEAHDRGYHNCIHCIGPPQIKRERKKRQVRADNNRL
ncbi:hypothetical protein [Nitrososphaera sp.]|uniref:hypothetical protein n=1 Tax=Nitrososphaera sp. TaxID=1971748 RepID=UPI00307F9F09